MPVAWLTYAWRDNQDQQIDYIVQELEAYGVQIRLDRRDIIPGQLLWDQIASLITNPTQSDGLIIYVTANSLASKPCREELAYALNRTLGSNNNPYPIIAILPGNVDRSMLPASISSRLYVMLNAPDWKERIRAGLSLEPPNSSPSSILPYSWEIHPNGPTGITFGCRPRVGTWNPPYIAVPIEEKELSTGSYLGPPGRPPQCGVRIAPPEVVSSDGRWWMMAASGEATQTMAIFASFSQRPSIVAFGQEGGPGYSLYLHRERILE